MPGLGGGAGLPGRDDERGPGGILCTGDEEEEVGGLPSVQCTGDSWPWLVETPPSVFTNVTAGYVLQIDR